MSPRLRFLSLIGVALNVNSNEAAVVFDGVKTRLKTKEEINASMTTDLAFKTVLSMNSTAKHPIVMSFIENVLGQATKKRLRGSGLGKLDTDSGEDEFDTDDQEDSSDSLAKVSKHTNKQQSRKNSNSSHLQVAKKKEDVTAARKELRIMIFDASTSLDLEVSFCRTYKRQRLDVMRQLNIEITYNNGQASYARSIVIEAQNRMNTITTQVRDMDEEQKKLKLQCDEELLNFRSELEITKRDIVVMGTILQLTDCSKDVETKYVQGLIQCPNCPDGSFMPHNPEVRVLLTKIQSSHVRDQLQKDLNSTWMRAASRQVPVFLTESQVNYFQGREPKDDEVLAPPSIPRVVPAGKVNVPDVPVPPAVHDCSPSTQCKLSGETCVLLLDRFLAMQAELTQKKRDLESNIFNKDAWCRDEDESITKQISTLETQFGEESEKLAKSTQLQQTSQDLSWRKSTQHSNILGEYKGKMDDCCATQNELQSEICALGKIRGELGKMSKAKDYVIDCEVSSWMDTECTHSCGGGELTRTRTVLTKPANFGMQCLPLQERENCNEQACPIDCVLHEWEHWSACSAQCGGGVRERTRTVRTQPANDGHTCEALTESESCNSQNCNADCVLSDWTTWGPCTKGCGVGSQRRIKTVETAALGEGFCAEATSEDRQEFKLCNTFECSGYLKSGETMLQCDSLIDIIFMLDGSATLGSATFEDEKKVVELFAQQSSSKVKIAVQSFSGPLSYTDLQACTGDASNVDVESVCNIKWIAHLNSEDNVVDLVKAAEYPDATTLMDLALSEAKAELINGRPEASSIVVVLSDAKPMVEELTREAAKRLQDKARLLFVPLGLNPPTDFLNSVVAMPKRDHIVNVPYIEDLTTPLVMNNIISSTCPSLR